MKILMISILAALSVNANEVVYGVATSSSDGQVRPSGVDAFFNFNEINTSVEVGAGEKFELGSLAALVTYKQDGIQRAFSQTRLRINVQRNDSPPKPVVTMDFASDQLGVTGSPDSSIGRGFGYIVGPCTISVTCPADSTWVDVSPDNLSEIKLNWDLSYKITKPSASGTTTSAPILLPPTQDAAQSWFVNLQVSSDLKTWEDVQPGQFLGSDSARFFRIKTSEQ